MDELDALDRAIVERLMENGRLSIRSIGRDLNLSEAAVRKRWKRLIDSNAFSYGLVVDLQVTGMSVHGWFYAAVKPDQAREFARTVTRLDSCSMCSLTSGEYNIIAYLYARDIAALAETIEDLSRVPGVMKTRFRHVVSHPKHSYEFVALSDEKAPAFWKID